MIAPCHFGLESVLKREVEQLGYEIVQVEDGRVTFRIGGILFAGQTYFCGLAERVLMKVGSFQAKTFDELFEKTKSCRGKLHTERRKVLGGKSGIGKSKLFSPSDIQSIMKKRYGGKTAWANTGSSGLKKQARLTRCACFL